MVSIHTGKIILLDRSLSLASRHFRRPLVGFSPLRSRSGAMIVLGRRNPQVAIVFD